MSEGGTRMSTAKEGETLVASSKIPEREESPQIVRM